MSCASPCRAQGWDVAGIHAAVRPPRAEGGLGPSLPLSTSPHSPSFFPIFPLQNANLPPCDALPLLLSSLCELVFSWAESQTWMHRGRGTVPWQDLSLCLEAPKHLLRASRRAWALGRVLATSVLFCSIRSWPTSAPGLWQLYLAVMLLPSARSETGICTVLCPQASQGTAGQWGTTPQGHRLPGVLS